MIAIFILFSSENARDYLLPHPTGLIGTGNAATNAADSFKKVAYSITGSGNERTL
jgi:hypothetical protein